MISAMVKAIPSRDSGLTSPKPTVETVVTVWYTASSGLNPNSR